MSSSEFNFWILTAVAVTGIYVLPSVVATFAGSHTLEFNTTNSLDDDPNFFKAGVCFGYCHEGEKKIENFPKCTVCHEYILNELNATSLSRDVMSSHTPPSQRSENAGDGDINYACIMCHHPPGVNVAGTHSKTIVVGCTYCHGNSTSPGIFNFETLGVDHPSVTTNRTAWVGPQLANPKDPHSNWFKGLELEYTNYIALDNTPVDKSYYACLGCHSHVGIDFNITRLNKYSITINKVSGYTVNAVVNTTSSTESIFSGPVGTKWN